MSIHKKQEIIAALHEKVNAFTAYIALLNQQQFEATPGNKWSAGQNLDHLIRAINPLLPAYSLPKFMLRMLFGQANRSSKSYDDLIAKYKAKLVAGGRASGPFIPPVILFAKKDALLRKYRRKKEKLARKIERQSEEDLDKYILPHPLLGKITLREMLYFTIHHNVHHLELLKERK
jgi:DinB superfamily